MPEDQEAEKTDKQLAREIDKAREDQEKQEAREAAKADDINPGVLYNPLATAPNPSPEPLPERKRPGPKTDEVQDASPSAASFDTRPNPTKAEPEEKPAPRKPPSAEENPT